MGEESSANSHDSRDEDDEDDYEEVGGENRLFGFLFGNVDGSGDLDVDYLDEDAKEHFSALADKLGPSLTDIDLSIKSTQIPADASEQDYDEKAEDAVDYEDIEEQYEGPEIQAISEEDHLLPKKEFFSAEVSLSTFEHSTSVFDEENYDEDEDFDEEHKVVDNSSTAQTLPSAGTLVLEHSSEQPCDLAFERDLELSLEKGTLVLEHGSEQPCDSAFERDLELSPEKGTLVLEPSSEQPCDSAFERDLELSLEKGPLVLEHSSEQPCNSTFERDLELYLEKDENLGLVPEEDKSLENTRPSLESFEAESLAVDLEDFQEEDEPQSLQDSFMDKSTTSLPILCIEDGMVVLRFSEIFGINEPVRKGEKRKHRYPIPKERHKSMDASDIVEEDEEAFLRGSCQSLSTSKQMSITQYDDALIRDGDGASMTFGVRQGVGMSETQAFEQRKVTCLSAEPMKESASIDLAAGWGSPSCPKFYPLDQQDWEDEIIWDNSPIPTHESPESCAISGVDSEGFTNIETELGTEPRNLNSEIQVEPQEKDHNLFLSSFPVLVEPFGSRKFSDPSNLPLSEISHPQLLRLESRFKVDDSNDSEVQKESNSEHLRRDDAIRHISKKLSLRNMDMLDGSWLDNIIWEPNERISKPKLILDLQDEQMLFEILENRDAGHLRFHAGAMIITRSAKLNGGDCSDVPGQGGASVGRFNISNDKYYSNRKTSQQLKSHSKKRAAHGVKVLHSIPALKLQTMKPKLSNKDIANFHRPKALWYPHDNEVAAKEQGKLSTQGPMKIILKSMGGKGSKLHVDAEEIVSSVKSKASKKLDFKPSEKVKIVYSGKELEDIKSLAIQNVRPNSVLHLVRTKIHPWPRAQKVPGENKSLRPPGAFKKKSDLSVKDGHIFLMEYCEERPLLLGNAGMGARLCTYYQKSAPGDQTASVLRNGSGSLGTVIALDPADKSPFLGDIRPGCTQSCLETNMYRAPIFPHKLPTTDYLLVRSAKGKISLRRIDRIHVVGQQEPHMEVISPGSKSLQTYIGNRLLVYMYRECRANEKRGLPPCIRADELSAQFPILSEPILRKRLKHCADLQKGSNGQLFWVIRRNFRIPLEEELRRMVTPENVCSYESMQAGLYRLKRLGISRLTHPTGLSSAMNQLPDEAIALAASSHIERELQITPWNLTSNFVACTNQDRDNIERLEITGVGDPSGRGLGFSYVRVAPKAPISSAVVKKKAAAPRGGGSTVTGTDADLRRLSMEGAREVLLKFNVPEEQIAKQTRWHRIAMIRKLSSEQASSGVKVDPTTIGKYARGQRMSFLQLQQQTREKCQEIWDRQLQSLSAAEGDENESDSEANSDLDSFAGDLENLLDAEECGEAEVGNYESKREKADGVRGLKMRRRPTQAQAEEEIEDEAAEAAELCRMLMDDDEAERRKKKKAGAGGREEVGLSWQSGFGSESAERTKKTNTIVKQIIRTAQPDGSFTSKENIIRDPKEVENILAKRTLSGNIKSKKGNGKNDIMRMAFLNKKTKMMGDGFKVIKDKKHTDKPVREGFVCGACGQSGHMRTNKNCPRYGEDLDVQVESSGTERISGKPNFQDSSAQFQPKPMIKKIIPKIAAKVVPAEAPENTEKVGSKTKLKLKCGTTDKPLEQITLVGPQNSDKLDESGNKSISKISKIKISNKMKPEDVQVELQIQKPPAIVIRPPMDTERQQLRKKIIIKQPKGIINVDQVQQEVSYGMQEEHRKTKKMIELSSFGINRKQENKRLAEEAAAKRKAQEERERRFWEEEEKRRFREEEEKRRIAEKMREAKERMLFNERRVQEEQRRLDETRRYHEAMQREREEQERQKMKKKKKIKLERRDDYLEEQRGYSNRKVPERNRAAKKRPVIESSGRFGPEYGQQTKRRRGGEGQVGLSNTLDNILDGLKDAYEVSYLFLKPVSKKEAPDYLDIIKDPMDLSTIREKARRMEYKSRDEFRHDVWQITYNAHKYNDNRNPGIPPLADQLLELCDYLLDQNEERLNEAEAGI